MLGLFLPRIKAGLTEFTEEKDGTSEFTEGKEGTSEFTEEKDGISSRIKSKLDSSLVCKEEASWVAAVVILGKGRLLAPDAAFTWSGFNSFFIHCFK